MKWAFVVEYTIKELSLKADNDFYRIERIVPLHRMDSFSNPIKDPLEIVDLSPGQRRSHDRPRGKI